MTTIRLSKALAGAGVASRRKAEEMIFDGLVSVNGKQALLPQTMVDPEKDEIKVKGKPILGKEEKIYFIINKPTGFLCSHARGNNPKNQRLVIDIFHKHSQRLFTVGRLDRDTKGLLIVTNDGEYCQQVIHPSSDIEKEYLVKVNHFLTEDHLKKMASGTVVEGKFCKPIKVQKVRKGTVKIVIKEGRKREVRCLVQSAGLSVSELKRIRIGGLLLGKLPEGAYRVMTERERQLIFE